MDQIDEPKRDPFRLNRTGTVRRRRDGSGQQRENGWNLVLSYTHSEFPDEIETTPIIAPLWTFFGPLVLGIVSSQELEFHFQATYVIQFYSRFFIQQEIMLPQKIIILQAFKGLDGIRLPIGAGYVNLNPEKIDKVVWTFKNKIATKSITSSVKQLLKLMELRMESMYDVKESQHGTQFSKRCENHWSHVVWRNPFPNS
uniref:Uncharacterized protein n=1 Tax=Cucumis melo TaxID=3656 RepID=A0A9I9EJE6_CUCME